VPADGDFGELGSSFSGDDGEKNLEGSRLRGDMAAKLDSFKAVGDLARLLLELPCQVPRGGIVGINAAMSSDFEGESSRCGAGVLASHKPDICFRQKS